QSVNRAQVYHNSINMDVSTSGGTNAALYFNSGSTNDVRNNNLAVTSPTALTAYSLFLSASTVLTNLDYNNYYNRSSTNLLNIGGANYTASNFKAALPTGGGLNSLTGDA